MQDGAPSAKVFAMSMTQGWPWQGRFLLFCVFPTLIRPWKDKQLHNKLRLFFFYLYYLSLAAEPWPRLTLLST